MTLANGNKPLRVLAVCAFPVEAAATRFRLQQFIDPLKDRGIELTISPFLSSLQFKELYKDGNLFSKSISMFASVARRFVETFSIARYDLIFIQREAMIFGPGIFEWLYKAAARKPIVLDLDDATYIRYVSPTYGRLGSALKFFGKTDNLIPRSSAVVCGNRFIANYVTSKGGSPVVIPTVVDNNVFKPQPNRRESDRLTVGWIGTHSTFPFLAKILPVLERLSEKFSYVLKIVGAGDISFDSLKIDLKPVEWNLEREPQDFSSLDIGLYPIFPEGAANEEWIKGKSGFKAIQYLACGVPFVMSPVGVCSEIGTPGITHFNAVSENDWYNSLSKLLSEPETRKKMGEAGRKFSMEHFSIEQQAEKLANVLQNAARR